MRFTVPQFIEHEPKLFFGVTFKQTVIIGFAVAIALTLWFLIGATNFFLFVFLTIVLVLSAFAFAFIRINGRPLPLLLAKFISFSAGTKIYLWRRKDTPPKMMKRVAPKAIETDGLPSLKFAEKSRLKKLSTQIETRLNNIH
ncbi:MAG: PrgI family protein [Patescibacteria group bacterium]